MKNGDKVKYRRGLTFTYIGENPTVEGESFCINTNGKIDSFATKDLSTFLGHNYTDEEVIEKILNRKRK